MFFVALSVVASAEPAPPTQHTYTPKYCYLPRGFDVLAPKLNCTIVEAEAACSAEPECLGFCFEAESPPERRIPIAKVYFKNHSACDRSNSWITYLRDYVAPPPPPPESEFCPQYHPIRNPSVYDPSGPLLDEHGLWHTWEDYGAWSHWTSHDLIHWNGTFARSTHFGGDTGSVSPTASGVYAFWPIMPHSVQIGSARARTPSLTDWEMRGPTIDMPKRINAGFRDPVRAFEYRSKWYVGVGCGSHEEGAQFCLFEASNSSLASFTDRGSLFTTNTTYGEVNKDIVWVPHNVSANMME